MKMRKLHRIFKQRLVLFNIVKFAFNNADWIVPFSCFFPCKVSSLYLEMRKMVSLPN
jgi:hypothetical protein